MLGTLRGVSLKMAAWKPAPDRHSIWALTLHIAYWKYAVRRRITGEERGGFPRSPSNFPRVPEHGTATAWDEDRALLRDSHLELVKVVENFDPRQLDDLAGAETKTTYADLIWGIVLHDTYHVGQIQMLKRLWKSIY